MKSSRQWITRLDPTYRSPTTRAGLPFTLVSAIKACTACRELSLGRKLYSDALETGALSDNFVASALVDMFSKCGSMSDARSIFKSVRHPDVALWNALMLGYARNGESYEALEIFQLMKENPGCQPNERTYVGVFMACGSLAAEEEGREVDGRLVKLESLHRGMEAHSTCNNLDWKTEIFLGNALVDMYAKCGSVKDSRGVLDGMKSHDIVSWNALLLGYADNGESQLAVELFRCMNTPPPNPRTYVSVLMSCITSSAEKQKLHWSLEQGMSLHSKALESNNLDIYVGNTLVELYSKCNTMVDARSVFDKMEFHDVVSWTNLIRGYAENGDSTLALELFRCMKAFQSKSRLELDSGAYVAALAACSTLSEVRYVHTLALNETFFHSDKRMIAQTGLVDLYSRLGSLVEAKGVFDSVREPALSLWNALLMAYEENGYSELTLEFYVCMARRDPGEMNSRTFVAALMACASLAEENSHNSSEFLKTGMEVHAEARRRGYQGDIYVGSALINMYSKCRSLERAREVFNSFEGRSKDVVLWTALVTGYVDNGEYEMALEAFRRMQHEPGSCSPNARTLVAVIQASWSLEKVMEVHAQAAKSGYDTTETIVANRLMEKYTRLGSMADARRVFDRMERHEIVSWTALLQGYPANGEGKLALELFFSSCMLEQSECAADTEAFVAALVACGSSSDVQAGRELHFEIARRGLESELAITTSLVDLYGKAARMVNAQHVFDSMQSGNNNVPWNALMTGYSHKGDSDQVLRLFREMMEAGVKVDEITYVSVLAACSHAGLVEEGRKLFQTMQSGHGVIPCIEHYTCMVDLLARANHLQEAVTLVESMPVKPDVLVWTAVLGGCWKWRNVEVGKVAFDGVVRADPRQVAAYVLMSNIYESVGMWDARDSLQTLYDKMVDSPCTGPFCNNKKVDD